MLSSFFYIFAEKPTNIMKGVGIMFEKIKKWVQKVQERNIMMMAEIKQLEERKREEIARLEDLNAKLYSQNQKMLEEYQKLIADESKKVES